MRLLLIKTSSLGDIIHTYPALTDALHHIPNLTVDWLVEEGFVDLPALHPAVNEVIPLPWRRLRNRLWHPDTWQELGQLKARLKANHYDLVLDAQGLLKSAIWGKMVSAPVAGLDGQSAREPLAQWFYDHRYSVAWGQHAIDRLRLLFAQALNYPTPNLSQVNYALSLTHTPPASAGQAPYWFFAHATTWESKHWPERYWHELVAFAGKHGRQVWVSYHNEEEEARAQRLARLRLNVRILPPSNLTTLASVLANAELVVGVDTGLTHLATALDRPVIALYGATEAGLTGVVGAKAQLLQSDYACSPCLREQCIELTSTQTDPPCYRDKLSAVSVMHQITEQIGLTKEHTPEQKSNIIAFPNRFTQK